MTSNDAFRFPSLAPGPFLSFALAKRNDRLKTRNRRHRASRPPITNQRETVGQAASREIAEDADQHHMIGGRAGPRGMLFRARVFHTAIVGRGRNLDEESPAPDFCPRRTRNGEMGNLA